MSGPGVAGWGRFAEKVQLALESSRSDQPDGGTSGLEVEYNIVDRELRPVVRVGTGPESRSFAEFLHDERIPAWSRDRFQLEVFHWMTEAVTRPHYSAAATAAEAKLLEAVLLDVLAEISLSYGEELYCLHGNIPAAVVTSAGSIPDGWNLAKRRYLARCVELFGERLATAGIHTNHSYPEALLSWDFVHLPVAERNGRTLEDYRTAAVIRATRLLRPFCPVFIAVSAASPLAAEEHDGASVVVLSEVDSNRLLAFPNPPELDIAGLYTSHADYLRLSYDLVRRGVRFGANNWTPVRARSGVDPVNRNILTTSQQLRELYRRGVFTLGEHGSLEESEQTVIVENLCARVDLPMHRVEVRTDEGGEDLDMAVAKVLLKDLMLLRIYGDREYGEGYRYDAADIARARRNEAAAARDGLSAQIENPFNGRTVSVREMLGGLLDDLQPLASALGWHDSLAPLKVMATGGTNPASALRVWFKDRLGRPHFAPSGRPIVDRELVWEWMQGRQRSVAADVAGIAAGWGLSSVDRERLEPLLEGLGTLAADNPSLPVRLDLPAPDLELSGVDDRTAEVVQLAARLVAIPSVTNCPDERVDEVLRCARLIAGQLRQMGLEIRFFDTGPYPAILAGFPGGLTSPVVLSGHFDVVMPEPDDRQFVPRIEGEYLWGRGSADMKTVVASNIVWMQRILDSGPPYPGVSLLLVGNEENGEAEPFGTPHVLAEMKLERGWVPELMLVGERTGEKGHEDVGTVCTANRGVIRLRVVARGRRGHSGTGAVPGDLLDRLVEARHALGGLAGQHLTLASLDGWESAARFPFLQVGEIGVYNITAGEGVLGIEVRPIPEDDLEAYLVDVRATGRDLGLDIEVEVNEGGIICPPDNPHLRRLLEAVETETGEPAVVGRKKPGTQARFAPGGNAVVWGQTGIGPHAADERHYIPSIEPYLRILDRFAGR